MKRIIFHIIALIIVSSIGIGSRYFSEFLPDFIAKYTGDAMWASAVYILVRMVFKNLNMLWVGSIAFTISVIDEITQLYHAAWIEAIRETTVGGLILGFSFKWSDLLCYFTGVLICIIFELLFSYISTKSELTVTK